MRLFQSWRMLNSALLFPVKRLFVEMNVRCRGNLEKKFPAAAAFSSTT
jgi:hypothetical protein